MFEKLTLQPSFRFLQIAKTVKLLVNWIRIPEFVFPTIDSNIGRIKFSFKQLFATSHFLPFTENLI